MAPLLATEGAYVASQMLIGLLFKILGFIIFFIGCELTTGFLGAVIAWNIAYATESKADGTRHFVYEPKSQRIGRLLLVCVGALLVGTTTFIALR